MEVPPPEAESDGPKSQTKAIDEAPRSPTPPAAAGAHSSNQHPTAGSDVTQLGITLKGLRKLVGEVKRICEEGGTFQADFDNLTTTELVYK